MPSDTAGAAGPSPEHFAGDSPAQIAKRLFAATRPKFFPASVLPVIVGSAWGFATSGGFDVTVFVLALFATVCVHAGANVLNDVGDDAGGTDRRNADRIYPYTGGSRFIQAGIISPSGMARLGMSLLAVAAVAGVLLLMAKGPMVLFFGIAGVLLAVLYSLGPLRLSSIGLGEIAVGIAFGEIPITGAAWLQSGVLNLDSLLFAIPVSAWVAAIMLINEVPDIGADAATGKRTLPVRLGLSGTAAIYLFLQLLPAAVVAWHGIAGPLPLVAVVAPLLLALPAFKAATAIRRGIENREAMTKAIEATLAIHTIGALWMSGVALYLGFSAA